MKTIKFTNAQEFANFKNLANQMHLMFMYWVSRGIIHVEAEALKLDELGY